MLDTQVYTHTHTHTHTHSEHFLLFHGNNGYANAIIITFIRTCLSRFILFRGLGFVFRLRYQIFNPKCLVVFVILYECTLNYMTKPSMSILSHIAFVTPHHKTCES